MRRATPIELLQDTDAPLLELSWSCNRCGRRDAGAFEYACIDPNRGAQDASWDGILLSRIVTCQKCGAADDYTLTGDAMLRLTVEVGSRGAGAKRQDRVIFGISLLWDGSRMQRPSQGLARLRQIVSEQPQSAEAHRRLGNLCERFGPMDEAVASWTQAAELDEAEVEACYSLTCHWAGPGQQPELAFAFLKRAVQALPKAIRRDPEKRRYAAALASFLRDVVELTREPIALMACWSYGEMKRQAVVNASSVDLRKVKDFELLAEFLGSKSVLSLSLTSELPGEEPTILERLLADEPFETPAELIELAPREPLRRPKAPGRNDPCPCGSGQKHKRCCLAAQGARRSSTSAPERSAD